MNALRPRRDPDPPAAASPTAAKPPRSAARRCWSPCRPIRSGAGDRRYAGHRPGSGTVTYSRFVHAHAGCRDDHAQHANSAIIEWRPPPILPDPYIFLPAGNIVTFENGAGISNFAVLNRIITNVPSRFEGQVISRIADSLGNRPGGTVLFSGPGGIVVGPLRLLRRRQSRPHQPQRGRRVGGNFITPSGGFRFATATASQRRGHHRAGSQIIASSENSYVALVAPRSHPWRLGPGQRLDRLHCRRSARVQRRPGPVRHRRHHGQRQSDADRPRRHDRRVGSSGPGDNHVIYAVAIPKDQAIQMLLGGNMGYDLAVGVDNGAIVLSAGHNITGGRDRPRPRRMRSPPTSSSRAAPTLPTSSGRATRDALARTVTGSPITASESLTLRAQSTASLVTDGADASLGGALSLTAQKPSGAGGLVRLEAGDGTRIDVAGDATLAADSDANVGVLVTPPTGGDALGGTVEIVAAGGTIAVAGSLTGTRPRWAASVPSTAATARAEASPSMPTAARSRSPATSPWMRAASAAPAIRPEAMARGGTARATATTSVGDILVDGTLLVDASGRGAIALGSARRGTASAAARSSKRRLSALSKPMGRSSSAPMGAPGLARRRPAAGPWPRRRRPGNGGQRGPGDSVADDQGDRRRRPRHHRIPASTARAAAPRSISRPPGSRWTG